MLFGQGLNDEEFTGKSLLAAVLMLTGIVFINIRTFSEENQARQTPSLHWYPKWPKESITSAIPPST